MCFLAIEHCVRLKNESEGGLGEVESSAAAKQSIGKGADSSNIDCAGTICRWSTDAAAHSSCERAGAVVYCGHDHSCRPIAPHSWKQFYKQFTCVAAPARVAGTALMSLSFYLTCTHTHMLCDVQVFHATRGTNAVRRVANAAKSAKRESSNSDALLPTPRWDQPVSVR
jgi:hypothetical protein